MSAASDGPETRGKDSAKEHDQDRFPHAREAR